jgi:hypothetical protein
MGGRSCSRIWRDGGRVKLSAHGRSIRDSHKPATAVAAAVMIARQRCSREWDPGVESPGTADAA